VIPHFDALRLAFVDFNAVLQRQDVLESAAIEQLHAVHFRRNAFPTHKAKSRPQFSEDVYPSLFRSLKVLPDGRPIDCQNLPRPWNNWDELNNALIDNPLARVLMGFIWKQGDISTLWHVFRGLHGEKYAPSDSIVMYQFGKHLADPVHNPIFDQHTYRAFGLLEAFGDWKTRDAFNSLFGKPDGVKKGNALPAGALQQYLTWWNGVIAARFPQTKDERLAVMSAIDKFLFSSGKAAKLQANA
jgi:hypothetical protein